MKANEEVVEQSRRINLPELYPKQADAFFNDSQFSYVEGSTKSGKTVAGLTWILYWTFKASQADNYWWVAPVAAQANIARDRIVNWLPDDGDLFDLNKSENYIDINHAGKLWFKGADRPDTLYGEDVYGTVMDEAPRAREEAYEAVRSTLTATSGDFRAVGNVQGRSNWHYEKCRQAKRGELKDSEYHKLVCWDAVEAPDEKVPVTESDIEQARQDLRPEKFRALYLCEPPDEAGNPFGMNAITKMVQEELADGEPTIWGWDVARSADYTVGIGLNDDGDISALERFQHPWPETRSDIVRKSGGVPIIVDKTGVGDAFVQFLSEEYQGRVVGFHFSQQKKQVLYDHLREAVQSGQIKGVPRGSELEYEMRKFRYSRSQSGLRYAPPPGVHDDCVDALALAWRMYRKMRMMNRRKESPSSVSMSSGGIVDPFS